MAKLKALLKEGDPDELEHMQLKRTSWAMDANDAGFNSESFFTPRYMVNGHWYGLIHYKGFAEPHIDIGTYDDWFVYTRKELA